MKKFLASLPIAETAPLTALLLLTAIVATTGCSSDDDTDAMQSTAPQVTFKTTAGDFTIELYPDKAPNTVKNFLAYVEKGLYVNTVFHRVVKDFVIQGGGFNEKMEGIKTLGEIENEADNGLLNEQGTVAMARTSAPHSASSQFFVNLKNNAPLDHKDKTAQGWGYCVFGKVTEGMETVQKIGQVQTIKEVPQEPIIVTEVSLK